MSIDTKRHTTKKKCCLEKIVNLLTLFCNGKVEVKQSDGVSYHLPSNAKTIILFQVRDRVFRCDQPDMDRSLWYVYVSMVTVCVFFHEH